MLQSRVVSFLILLISTSNGLDRNPLKRYQRSVQALAKQNGKKMSLKNDDEDDDVATIRDEDDPRDTGVVDNGNPLLSLPSINCKECDNDTKFQCANGVDAKLDLEDASLRFCLDNITLGGLRVQDQHLLLLEAENKFLYSTTDGFLGMGCKARWNLLLGNNNNNSCSHIPEYTLYQTVPENMIQQGLVSSSIFSLYSSRGREESSELILGGSDPAHYTGNLNYAYVLPEHSEWKARPKGFTFGFEDISQRSEWPCTVEIRTGSTTMFVPVHVGSSLFQSLVKSAPSVTSEEYRRNNEPYFSFTVDSKDVPNLEPIHIYIAGDKFTLKPDSYVVKIAKDQYELLLQLYDENYRQMGKPFLRKVYTEFDVELGRIGFARAK